MPAGMVRPRASQVPPLGDAALSAYAAAGWQVTPDGRVGTGSALGPCARCRQTTRRYGPAGNPLCPTCRSTSEVSDG